MSSSKPSSYAEMVREDAEGNNADKPCAIFHYETTGLEIDPIMAICACIVDTTLNKGGINNEDATRLLVFFDEYKSRNPQDINAQKVGPNDINAIAKFIMEYDKIGTDFMDLKMENPNDKVLDGIAEKGIHDVAQYMEGRYRADKAYFDALRLQEPENDKLKQVSEGGKHSIFRFVRAGTKSAVQQCLSR